MQGSANGASRSQSATTTARTASRRFSFGGRDNDLTEVHGWKFDVLIRCHDQTKLQKDCFVQKVTRGEALQLLFANHPGSQVFGTGLPFTITDILAEVGRPLAENELLLVT